MSNYEEISVDKYIGKALDITIKKFNESALTMKKQKFSDLYSKKSINDIEWITFCEDVNYYKCYKFALVFFVELLKYNIYQGSYSEYLYSLKMFFEEVIKQRSVSYTKIFCKEKITELIIYKKNNGYSLLHVARKNNYIREELTKFLIMADCKYKEFISPDFLYHFELSFSQYDTISSYTDFNGNTFFTQISYYKNLYIDNEKQKNNAISSIIMFYRYLINTYTEYDFFEKSLNINKKLLFNRNLKKLISENYYFTTFSPTNHLGEKDKICFLIKGYEQESTRISNDDYIYFDISNLSNNEYKKFIWSFMLSSSSIIFLTWSAAISYVVECLQFLLKMKTQKNYPNKSTVYFTNQEAILLRQFIDTHDISLSTKNNKIGAIRRFFSFTKENKLMKFDDMFFDYLKQYEEPIKNKSKAIPDNELVLINSKLVEKAKEDKLGKIIYAIFHLALQTEFRISQICHLKIDCIKPSIKPNQFMVCTNSKTSHGRVDSYIITDLTYKILMDIIDDTEEIRNKCNIESLKDYIFLCDGITDSVELISNNIFGTYLKKICKELNLKNTYTAINLRYTHMTKAFEHVLRSGKSDVELSLLSKHKHIDTTKNHYIEIELEKMLESTYGIIIGEEYIDTESKIVEEIPLEFNSKESDVENGCGKCTAECCVITSSLPCLACKHFITTSKHEIYFKKAIQNIDRLLEKTTNIHEKEDLVTIKQLYVLYLKSIYKLKEDSDE